ncbi:unnamed protein product [Citrullus colocynthis]|uniref:Uncharacterized protein n=1 Tax=Citrullus colocynthis TaxID=252529 RepID=A0ABP0Z1H4_9ROSI
MVASPLSIGIKIKPSNGTANIRNVFQLLPPLTISRRRLLRRRSARRQFLRCKVYPLPVSISSRKVK